MCVSVVGVAPFDFLYPALRGLMFDLGGDCLTFDRVSFFAYTGVRVAGTFVSFPLDRH